MKPRFHPCSPTLTICIAALLASSTSIRAIDFSSGTGRGTAPWAITASDQARELGFSGSFGTPGNCGSGVVGFRDISDHACTQFNLSSPAGAVIIGTPPTH